MTPPRPPTERLEKLFHRRKCWMLDQLAVAPEAIQRFFQEPDLKKTPRAPN
jgi:hypothetical protein